MTPSWLPLVVLIYAGLFGLAHGQNETDTGELVESNDNTEDNEDGLDGVTGSDEAEDIAPSVVPADCHCGFLDPLTGRSYTDSLIVYFNETGELGDAFNVSSYEHPYEKGWGVYFREGALESNVYYENGSTWNLSPGWLNLNVSARTSDHLVSGAEIETKRQDMLYGTFRTFLRSAAPYAGGGSALSMRLLHNDSISAELDLLSMDDSGNTAKFAATTNGQIPLTENTVNYTTLQGPDYNQSPWDFWEYRMDWDEESIEWFSGVNKTRTMPAANWTVPVSFSLKHWSLGLPNWMQGPPLNDSGAAVGWMRLFFNSSVSSSDERPLNCSTEHYCSTEDETLRVSTPYTAAMEVKPGDLLEIDEDVESRSTVAIALAIASVVVTSALIVVGLSKKAISKKPATRPPLKSHQSDVELSQVQTAGYLSSGSFKRSSNDMRRPTDKHQSMISQNPLLEQTDSQAGSSVNLGGFATPFESRDTLQYSMHDRQGSVKGPSRQVDSITPTSSGRVYSSQAGWEEEPHHLRHRVLPASEGLDTGSSRALPNDSKVESVVATGSALPAENNAGLAGAVPGANEAVKPSDPMAASAKPVAAGQVPQQRTRVDYLAGLVALCSLLVASTHFVLTYAPSTVMEYIDQHYTSEYWARRTIEPFFFNNIWTGLFFTTSTRFLTTGYLRKGDLKFIAEKTVCRTPRFMIPIVSVILLEYFLMDVGAVTYLEYLPSITWSPWPMTSVYPNFGWFINETLQLIYLIPNAAPQLTWNYCTGKESVI